MTKPQTGQAQLLDTFDSSDRPVGPRPRDEVHREGLWHHSFHCWIAGRDRDGNISVVFQKRGPLKRDYPDRLDISSAGHLLAGEEIDGGRREMREELGIEVRDAELLLLANRRIDEALYNGTLNREFQRIYLLERAPEALAGYRPSYPEVAAVMTISLDSVLGLFSGAVGTAEGQCRNVDPDGRIGPATAVAVGEEDFIRQARSYLICALDLVRAVLSGRVSAGQLADRTLDDGSQWSPNPELAR
jgi:isopentenyldiphosphate isomerase